MMRLSALLLASCLCVVHSELPSDHGEETTLPDGAFYALEANDIDGNEYDFDSLEGKAVFIMNVAYGHKDTERFMTNIAEMGDKYASVGLQILLFPSDQFGDSATDKQYKSLVHKRQEGVKMMGKAHVHGKKQHPVFALLNAGTVKSDFGALHLVDHYGKKAYKYNEGYEPRAKDIERHIREVMHDFIKARREL